MSARPELSELIPEFSRFLICEGPGELVQMGEMHTGTSDPTFVVMHLLLDNGGLVSTSSISELDVTGGMQKDRFPDSPLFGRSV